MSSPNPYDKIFNDDPISGGNEKRNRLVHGLYDLDYNHYQRVGQLYSYVLDNSIFSV